MSREVWKVEAEGFRELDAALTELPKATGKNVARKALIAAGTPIQQAAEARAPSRDGSDGEKTFSVGGIRKIRRRGTLRALVQIGFKLSPRQARAARKEGKSSVEIYVGTRDRIGRLEEFGTSRARATPFLRPAWDAGWRQALDTIRRVLAEEIQKAADRLARKAARLAAKQKG